MHENCVKFCFWEGISIAHESSLATAHTSSIDHCNTDVTSQLLFALDNCPSGTAAAAAAANCVATVATSS